MASSKNRCGVLGLRTYVVFMCLHSCLRLWLYVYTSFSSMSFLRLCRVFFSHCRCHHYCIFILVAHVFCHRFYLVSSSMFINFSKPISLALIWVLLLWFAKFVISDFLVYLIAFDYWFWYYVMLCSWLTCFVWCLWSCNNFIWLSGSVWHSKCCHDLVSTPQIVIMKWRSMLLGQEGQITITIPKEEYVASL